MPKGNILLICAHSDDHIFGVGGTIAKYAQEGKNVQVIILSYGEKTHPWLKARFAKDMRAKETAVADRIVGCKSQFFDFKEGNFKEGYQDAKPKLLSIVKKINPVRIFTHSNEDPHPDHRAAYHITLDLIKDANISPQVYCFSIWNPFSIKKNYLPQLYVDITQTHQTKFKAIRIFKSQWAALIVLLWSIFTRELKHGLHMGTKFAEQFYRVR